MSLIGTGTKVIPNVVSTATWRSLDLDQGFAAFAEQLGGLAWSGGVPLLYAGNLTATNFATGMLLGNEYLMQPYAAWSMTVNTKDDTSGSAIATGKGISGTAVEVSSVGFASFVPSGAAATVTGDLRVTVDGGTKATIPVSIDRTGSDQFRVVQISASFLLRRGSVIGFDMADLSISGTPYNSAGVNMLPRCGVTLVGKCLLGRAP